MKRFLDFTTALVMFFALFPIMIIVALVILLGMGSPVLFRQRRPGRNCKPFTVLKFRTMSNAKSTEDGLLSSSDRLTGLGRFLRKTSLDELPQLINVLRGEMSLVGPRPLLMEYLEHYSDEQRRRHNVTPGITGYAQINGRNSLSWEEKFKLDVWYVDNRTLLLDFKILLLTFWKVLRRESTSPRDGEIMSRFQGSVQEGRTI